jgi:putative transposase
MNTYKRHRFPLDIISYAVWLYYRFNLSHRDIEDLLAERGITVSYETIRLWYPKHSLRSWGRLCIKFGAVYSRRLKKKHRGYGDTFYIDEVFVKINGKHHYLWRAVDRDGEVVDVFLQAQRFVSAHAAVSNLFNLGRLLVAARHYRDLRISAFGEWGRVGA